MQYHNQLCMCRHNYICVWRHIISTNIQLSKKSSSIEVYLAIMKVFREFICVAIIGPASLQRPNDVRRNMLFIWRWYIERYVLIVFRMAQIDNVLWRHVRKIHTNESLRKWTFYNITYVFLLFIMNFTKLIDCMITKWLRLRN